jgi:hypothetical protein
MALATLAPSSRSTIWIRWPSTPPAAMISAAATWTARETALPISVPCPVLGVTTPIRSTPSSTRPMVVGVVGPVTGGPESPLSPVQAATASEATQHARRKRRERTQASVRGGRHARWRARLLILSG